MPDYATSRYKLKGPATIVLRPETCEVVVRSIQIDVPHIGTFSANSELDPGGWALKSGPRRLLPGKEYRFRIDLTRATFPTPNAVHFEVEASGPGMVRAAIGDGGYNPMVSTLVPTTQNHLGDYPVGPGLQVLRVDIPWSLAELIAYPTNFGKRIDGKQYNQYHWIHVDALEKIEAWHPSDTMRYYRDRWKAYPKRWQSMGAYDDERITLERYSPRTSSMVRENS